MANIIDLATYVAKFEADTSGIDESFDNADKSLKDKLSGMVNWSKVAVGGAIVGVVAGVGKVIKDGVQATATLDEQMSQFSATTGATSEEVEEVRNLAKELYKVNTDSMEDIIATSEAMKQAMGLTVEEIENSQQAMMDYAKTTERDNAETVKSIGEVGKAWDLTSEEMVKATDMFKKSSEDFGTDTATIEKAMKDLAPASQALGLEFEETNGLLNAMKQAGLDASSGVTALNFAAKTVESPEQFKQMMEDIQAIEDPTQRTQEAVELFGSRAGVAMSNVLDGSADLDEFMVSMADAEGTVASASAEFDGNFNVQLELAKKMFSGLTQEVGEKFMPIINTVLEWVMDNMPAIESTITGAIDVISAILSPFIELIGLIISVFQELFESNTETWEGIKETISSVTESIMDIVNAFIELFKQVWDKYGKDIIEFAQKQWESVKQIFEGVFKVIEGIFEAFTGLLTGDWEKFGEGLKKIIDGAWTAIKGIFENSINAVKGIFSGAITLLKDIATQIMDGVWDAFKYVWDNITQWVSDSFDNIGRTISNFGSNFYNAGKKIFSSLWDGLKGVWRDISGWVSDKVSWMADKLTFWRKSESEMDTGSRSSGRRSTPRGIASYDVGTNFVPMDGLAYLHKGEQVIPAAAQGRPYSGGNDITIQQGNIELKVEGNMDKSLLPEMKKMIDGAMKDSNSRLKIELEKVGVRPTRLS